MSNFLVRAIEKIFPNKYNDKNFLVLYRDLKEAVKLLERKSKRQREESEELKYENFDAHYLALTRHYAIEECIKDIKEITGVK